MRGEEEQAVGKWKMGKFDNGRMEEWNDGRMEEWNDGRMEALWLSGRQCNCQQPTFLTGDWRLPTANFKLQTANCKLVTANWRLSTF